MMKRIVLLTICILLLAGCNIWTLLVDTVPTGNTPGRVLVSTPTLDPTPSREVPPVIESPEGTRTDNSALGYGQAAGNADATPTIPPPPPVYTMTAQAAVTITPGPNPWDWTPEPCVPPPGAECGGLP